MTRQATRATTVRLEPEVQDSLDLLRTELSMTMNQVVNAAVAAYASTALGQQLSELSERQAKLSDRLDALKRYRERDSEFEEAIAAVVAAEIQPDPAEGEVIAGSPQAEIVGLLGG